MKKTHLEYYRRHRIHMLTAYSKALEKHIDHLESTKHDDIEFQIKRVYDWLMDENREPAQTKFTAGELRNLAREIEFRLSKPSDEEKPIHNPTSEAIVTSFSKSKTPES